MVGTTLDGAPFDLASLAGTSRLTVSRVLREMRERGTVEIRRGKLILKTGP